MEIFTMDQVKMYVVNWQMQCLHRSAQIYSQAQQEILIQMIYIGWIVLDLNTIIDQSSNKSSFKVLSPSEKLACWHISGTTD